MVGDFAVEYRAIFDDATARRKAPRVSRSSSSNALSSFISIVSFLFSVFDNFPFSICIDLVVLYLVWVSESRIRSFQLEVVDDKPFDVTLINPEDYVKIGSSNQGDVNENGEESETAEKPSRAQRKRLRKKMLKEEAARRKKVIGPLLPTEMLQIPDGRRVGDAGESNVKENSDGEEEAGGSNICSQLVRPNAQEKKEEQIGGNNMMRKVKKRREAKKLAKESCKIQDPTPENQIHN